MPSPRFSCSRIQVGLATFFKIQIELSFLEPIGGAGPKFAHESKGSILVKELSQAISLSCPAQGFPVPAFRLDFAKFWS